MNFTPSHPDRLINVYMALSQYPILSGRIRQQMRRELFKRGLVNPNEFENEVRHAALLSQEREGLRNPLSEDPAEVWESRMVRVRDQLTDLKFSHLLSMEVLENIISEVLGERGISEELRAAGFRALRGSNWPGADYVAVGMDRRFHHGTLPAALSARRAATLHIPLIEAVFVPKGQRCI